MLWMLTNQRKRRLKKRRKRSRKPMLHLPQKAKIRLLVKARKLIAIESIRMKPILTVDLILHPVETLRIHRLLKPK